MLVFLFSADVIDLVLKGAITFNGWIFQIVERGVFLAIFYLATLTLTKLGVVVDLTLDERKVEWVFPAVFLIDLAEVLLPTNNLLNIQEVVNSRAICKGGRVLGLWLLGF